MTGPQVPGRVAVLVAAAGAPWEAEALDRIERGGPRLVLTKRCVDLTDLLATASTGLASVAVEQYAERRNHGRGSHCRPVSLCRYAGLWRLAASGSQHPDRQCIAEMLMLAQFEHRTRICTRSIVSDHANRTVVNYSCGPSDFGQSQIDVITPRSPRISTQGISDLLPFNYVLQARRIGDCTASINRH